MNDKDTTDPYADFDITDAASRKTHLYRVLADSKDPMWCEIGGNLRDEQISLRQVFSDERYSDFISRGLAENSAQFFGSLSDSTDEDSDE